ncbi:MAG TPA: helix-turn-helix domain-containing protein [Actinophytocola sp.]|nr:helix-turn-helix domain-containing protein [Actinophytocola sp.]
MYRYEQHCPVARAAEVVTETWTLLILRELLRGSERRADIARGLPKMSSSLLALRLRTLEAAGLLTYLPGDNGEKRYRLTAAGRELRPIIDQLGLWGQRWLDSPRVGDLDPELLVFDICREIDRARLPAQPLTVEIEFADAPPPRSWWLALSGSGAVAHRTGPKPSVRTAVGVRLRCTLGALAGVWQGRTTWLQAVRDQGIMLAGDPAAIRSAIDCLGTSRYAAVPRPAPAPPAESR